jgi:zinc protease
MSGLGYHRLSAVVLTVAAFIAGGSRAQPSPPLPDPVFSVQRYRLPNGVEVFIKPRGTTHAVDVRVVVKVGFRDEAVPDSGLSHLLEHMMFKGTRRHDEIALNRIVDSKGAYSNGETHPEYTFYEVSIADQHFPFALEWLREIVTESRLEQRHLRQAREDVYSEQQGNYPRFVERIFVTGVFQPIEVRVPDVLFPSVRIPDRIICRLEHIDQKRLRAFYEQYYRPDNMAVIIVGNVDPDVALARTREAFGSLPRRPVPRSIRALPEARIPAGEIDTDLMPPVGEMTEIWRGVVTKGLSDPDRFTLRVIQSYLDRRIFEEIRSRRALGYSLGARAQDLTDTGLLYGYARVKRSAPAEREAKQILEQLFRELRERPLSESDLQEAKDTILGRGARIYETNPAIAGLYLEWFMTIPYGNPLPNHFASIAAVTTADVQRVARERFRDGRTFTATERPTLSFLQGGIAAIVVVMALLAIALIRRRRTRRASAVGTQVKVGGL